MGKSKVIAGVLALVGGVIGMHKFYLNDAGSGIFYAFISMLTSSFFFMPVGAMLGVIDAIKLFNMTEEQFDAKYNKNLRARQQRSRGVQREDRNRRSTRQQRAIDIERNKHKNKKTTSKFRKNPFRKSADEKFKEYDLEGALHDYEKAAEISAPDKAMYFNLACIYSLMEKTDLSLEHLEKAMDLGFKDVEKMRTIDELAYLRIQPDYEAFVANGYKRVARQKSVKPPKGDLLQDDLLLSQLNKLKELRSRGLLSEKEFSYEKEKLMRR